MATSISQHKIVFVITRADTMAGAQTHVLELSIALTAAGHEVFVICGPGRPLVERLQENHINVRSLANLTRELNPIRDAKALFDLRKVLKEIDPDLVSLHSSKAGILGRVVCKNLRKPVLFTAHGWAFADGVGFAKSKLYSTIERLLQFWCKRIICVSKADCELATNKGFAPNQLTVVHNGRHIRSHSKQARKSEEFVQIAMIGRLDAQKDHETLFRALSELDNYVLHLIGDGPKLDELQEKAEMLGIETKIRFVGLVKDAAQILDQSDVFVLSSHWEGFPRSTLEAMRSGLPVIVSDVGGSSEAVVEGVTGYVIPREDVNALSSALSELISDQGKRVSMGNAGRIRFEEYFTFEKMLKSTAEEYAKALEVESFPIEKQPL